LISESTTEAAKIWQSQISERGQTEKGQGEKQEE